jgi:hypothetical protein
MVTRWIGPANFLFIPLIVEDTAGYDPPPDGYRTLIQRRVFHDPDESGQDQSLMSYINSISYGRGWLNPVVSTPVTLRRLSSQDNPTLLAIYEHPDSHKYEYLAVVYPPNRIGAGGGMAQPGKIDFDPPREPNRTRARSRFRYDDPIGTWAMEVIHNVTNIGDYYNGESRLGRFEEMDAAAATHPTSYTKLDAGWLDPVSVPRHEGGTKTYTLHAIGLPHPAPRGRVAGVQVKVDNSHRYLVVEARLRSDRWDRGIAASRGIASEGVIVVEFAPDWPMLQPGPQPPLQLRTATALRVGETLEHHDGTTKQEGVADHRKGQGRFRTLTVKSAVPGGFVIEITTDDTPTDTPSSGTEWQISEGGAGRWRRLNTSAVRLADLAFGDFTGDGKADVFRVRRT